MKNKILFLWDLSLDSSIDNLREKFLDGPIFYNYDYFGKEYEIDIICSEKELLEKKLLIDYEKLCYYDAIFIKDELSRSDWNGETGINLLIKIRKTKYLNPIFYYSHNSKDELYKKDKYRILKTPSHYYVNSSFVIDMSPNSKPQKLTNELLEDILYYSTNNRGITEELLHNLKNKLPFNQDWDRNKIVEYAALIEQVENEIINFIPKNNRIGFSNLFSKVTEELSTTKLSPSRLIYSKKDELMLMFDEEKETTNKREFDWQVLFVDDEEKLRDQVQLEFEKRGLICHVAANAQQVYEILEQDFKGGLKDKNNEVLPSNTLTIVIADWRFQNDIGEWDTMQGYDIIDHIHNKLHNTLSYFVLTSKKGVIVNHAKQNNKIKISWHSKEDVLDSDCSFNLFYDIVCRVGETTFEAVYKKPSIASWSTKPCHRAAAPLGDYYRQFRNSDRYAEMESEISEIAVDFIEQAVYIQEEPTRISKDEGSQLTIDNIIDSDLQVSAMMNSDKLEDEWPRFRDRMAGRRVALALYKIYNWNDRDICSVLLSKKFGGEKTRWLFSEALSLSANLEKNFGDKMLSEEIAWFKKEYGFTIGLINDKLRQELRKLYSKTGRLIIQTLKHDISRKIKYIEKYPWIIDYKDPVSVDDIKQLFSDSKELFDSDDIFMTVQAEYESNLEKFLKITSNNEFCEKFGVY